MARAKNTDRAGARRKFREARAAELAAARTAGVDDDEEDELDPVTGRPLASTASVAPEPERPARPRFRLPNVRRDIADLPALFRERRLLWVPFVLVVVSFVAGMTATIPAGTSPFDQLAATLVQLVLNPQALLVFFLAGFIAPRASYLVGFLLGLFDGILFLIFLARLAPIAEGAIPMDTSFILANLGSAILVGTVGAAFAAWYRNFLRSSQERARAARVERDARQAAARKADARAAKRPAKTTPR